MQTLTGGTPIGLVTIGKTTYQVFRMEIGEESRKAGIENRFALEGPRGAAYMVTDYGKGYRINCVGVGNGRFSGYRAEAIRGITREHFTAFGVEA